MIGNRHSARAFIALLFILCLAGPALAQQDENSAFETRHYRKIFSRVLNETRTLRIYLPRGYAQGDKSYPVLYHLDADDDDFIRAIAAADRQAWPDLIVVGIANTDRDRDMFPVQIGPRKPTSGGGGDFLRFFTEELFKYVEKNYRTAPYRIIYGMSNSGFFAVYALAANPDAFDAAIAGSPMIGWSPEFILSLYEKLLAGKTSFDKFLYLIYGDDDHERVTRYVPDLVKILEEKAPPDFRCSHIVIKGGGHVPPGSLPMGLAELFVNRTSTEK